ncbi:MAG: NAD-dependent epimerase/dehydratase family protein, partial [Nitrospinales bacterium]
GAGIGHSLNQVKSIIEKVCNKKLKFKYRTKRLSDVECVILDNSRFVQLTDWQPETTFEDGILLTWQWIQNQQ